MSKQSKKRAHKRRKHKDSLQMEFVCSRCAAVDDGSPQAALQAVADVMNVCAGQAKIKVRHGIITSPYGYVLPMNDGRWAARTVTYDRFSPIPADVAEDGFGD